jgi:serine/threonine protein kinase
VPEQENDLVQRAQQRVGTVVNGKWTIDRLIGVGGMGAVYAATHRNKKKAALKMLHPELSFEASIKERFLREGYVANSVEHPGSVKVDDDDVAEDGSAYLVMELLDGEPIDVRWERKGRKLPPEEALSLADQLLDVLIAAHAANIVHRDLKPENIFLNRNGQIKVLDFGIARLREMGETSTATKTGSIMGTPAFMAPEQARGRWEAVDGRTDLWAVGATMFTLITGHYVHEAETVNETLALAMMQPARPIAQVMPDVPRPVAKVVDKALAYALEDRFQSAESMQKAVRVAYHMMHSETDARPPALSVPDGGELGIAPTVASEPNALGDRQSEPVEVHAVSARAGTAAAVTRTSPDAIPKTKVAPMAMIIGGVVGLLLVVGIVVAVSGGEQKPTVIFPSATTKNASQPGKPSAPPAPEVTPVAKSQAEMSLSDLPVEEEEKKEQPGAATTAAAKTAPKPAVAKTEPKPGAAKTEPKPGAAKTEPRPAPAPQSAVSPPPRNPYKPAAPPAPKPAPPKPKPAEDPFSVRR